MNKALKITLMVCLGLIGIAIVGGIATGITPLSMGLHDAYYQPEGIGLNGYDPVSYFSDTPQKGNTQYTYTWAGTEWQFATDENMRLFKMSPEKYAPQYGGYCMFAVSAGLAAPADASIWEIHNDKLYLFSNEEVKKEFAKNRDQMINTCDQAWQ